MKEKNRELLVLNEQVKQVGETSVAPMVTVSLVNVPARLFDKLVNKNRVYSIMIKYDNKMW